MVIKGGRKPRHRRTKKQHKRRTKHKRRPKRRRTRHRRMRGGGLPGIAITSPLQPFNGKWGGHMAAFPPGPIYKPGVYDDAKFYGKVDPFLPDPTSTSPGSGVTKKGGGRKKGGKRKGKTRRKGRRKRKGGVYSDKNEEWDKECPIPPTKELDYSCAHYMASDKFAKFVDDRIKEAGYPLKYVQGGGRKSRKAGRKGRRGGKTNPGGVKCWSWPGAGPRCTSPTSGGRRGQKGGNISEFLSNNIPGFSDVRDIYWKGGETAKNAYNQWFGYPKVTSTSAGNQPIGNAEKVLNPKLIDIGLDLQSGSNKASQYTSK